MKKDNQVGKELLCMQNLLEPQNKHHVHFVDYKEIVEKPVATMKGIYKFFNILRQFLTSSKLKIELISSQTKYRKKNLKRK